VTENGKCAQLAGVFGGGGLFGIGYAMGIIDGLSKRGINLAQSPMLGTSAGSWAAAATALGVTANDLIGLKIPRLPNPRPGTLAKVARRVFGEARHENVHVVACSLPRLRRTKLDGALTPLADLVAASSAVPGLLAPQRINGRLYIDGGIRSGTSVDLAPPAELLVVIAPLAGAMFGPFGGLVERSTQREIRSWEANCGGKTLLFSPRISASNIATRPYHLFSRSRAIAAYQCGLDESRNTPL